MSVSVCVYIHEYDWEEMMVVYNKDDDYIMNIEKGNNENGVGRGKRTRRKGLKKHKI